MANVNIQYGEFDSLQGVIENLVHFLNDVGFGIKEAAGHFGNFRGEVELTRENGKTIVIEYRLKEWPTHIVNEYYRIKINGKIIDIFNEMQELESEDHFNRIISKAIINELLGEK